MLCYVSVGSCRVVLSRSGLHDWSVRLFRGADLVAVLGLFSDGAAAARAFWFEVQQERYRS